MQIKRLGVKVSLIVTIIIAIIIGLTLWITMIRTEDLVKGLAVNEAKAANISFAKSLEALQAEAQIRAMIIAKSPDVIDAIVGNDIGTLKMSLSIFMPGLDDIALCDVNGNVLMRGQSDIRGDNILSQKALSTALSEGKGTSTIEDIVGGGLSTSGSEAIYNPANGKMIGAVVCGHDLSLAKYVDEIKERNNCEVTLFDHELRLATTLVDEKGERAVGVRGIHEIEKIVLQERNDYETFVTLFGSEFSAIYTPLIVDDEVIGMLYTGVNIDDARASQSAMISSLLLVMGVCGAVCIVLIFLLGEFAITRPLKKISVFARKLQDGDLGIGIAAETMTDVRSNDEIGAMARVLEKSYIGLRGYIGEIRERMQGLAAGDFVTESSYDFQGDFILIKESINNIVHDLNRTMLEVNQASMQVSASSAQIAAGAQSLAQGAAVQAGSIEKLSSFVNDVLERINMNVGAAKEADDLADDIRASAEKGSNHMENMMRAIREINEANAEISRVIKAIDEIAFQTNILALNAAVEAARAGMHGRGFAVVADEVRVLAAKSAVAAQDTEILINNSVEKANFGLRIATETAESLNGIVEGIKRSAEMAAEVAQASDEQASAIAEVNTGIDQMAQVVQENSATAEQSAAASEEMSGQSVVLQDMISNFKIKNA